MAYAAQPLVVGGDFGGAPLYDYFLGSLDQVAIWKRALSDAEIAALYGGGAGIALP